MTRAFLLVAVIVGGLVDAFFALVNFYPVAPQRGRGPERYVVMQLDEVQGAWFQANILDEFNDEHNANLKLIRVTNEEQIQAAVVDAATNRKDVVLVSLPMTQAKRAIQGKIVRPFTEVVPAAQIQADFAAVGPRVLASAEIDGRQFFLPGMAVSDVAAFRVSKVRDAVLHWSALRPQIEAALRRVNGRGLPAGYELKLSPESWDSYDVFVMAYYWAHRSYGGQPARPRIVHRTGDEIDGQQDIAAALYRMGATDATFATFDSPAIVDFFQWEALFRAEGLYPKEMLAEEPFDDEAVIAGVRAGEVYLAGIDEIEAFTVHGGAHLDAPAHVDDPLDLEFTSLPRGSSLALDKNGHPVRQSPSFSFREDWVWALPARGSPAVGYELVQFLWRPDIHARECEALGMLPLHPEVVAERVSRFRLDWMSHVFEAGLVQSKRGEPVPAALVDKGLGSIYAQQWTRIVAQGAAPPVPESGLVAILRAPPPPKALAIQAVDPHPAPSSQPDTEHTDGADDEPPAEAVPEREDWETDAVFQGLDAGAARGAHK